MKPEKFNVRVYGLLINDQKQVLVADEHRMGRNMTKFPGGGLEKGEGISDALKREWKEELSLDIKVDKLLYINDFYQQSAFDENDQIIAVYYQITQIDSTDLKASSTPFDFEEEKDGAISFRWLKIGEMDPTEMTFPIDQKVAQLLRTWVNSLN